jgi:hypothetical protein
MPLSFVPYDFRMLTAARLHPLLSSLLTVVVALGAFSATYAATGHSLLHLIGYPCK